MNREEAKNWAKSKINGHFLNDTLYSVFIFTIDYIFDNAKKENGEDLCIEDIDKFYTWFKSTWEECLDISSKDENTQLGIAAKNLILVHINKIFDINVDLYNYVNLYKNPLPVSIDMHIFNIFFFKEKSPSCTGIVVNNSTKVIYSSNGYDQKRYKIRRTNVLKNL